MGEVVEGEKGEKLTFAHTLFCSFDLEIMYILYIVIKWKLNQGLPW